MFYLLLILPHLLGIIGLIAWAARVEPNHGPSDGGAEGSDGGGGGGLEPPLDPQPVGPSGDLPLDGDASQPARRLRVHERLADLHPPRPRRDHEPDPAPSRTPVES